MTRRDEAGHDLAADSAADRSDDRSAVPAGAAARGTKATGTNFTGSGSTGTHHTGSRAAGSRATGSRAAGTSRFGAVLLLIGITATSLLIYVTDWPWWAIFALVGMPFLTAGVWCEVRAVRRSAAQDTECRAPSTW